MGEMAGALPRGADHSHGAWALFQQKSRPAGPPRRSTFPRGPLSWGAAVIHGSAGYGDSSECAKGVAGRIPEMKDAPLAAEAGEESAGRGGGEA